MTALTEAEARIVAHLNDAQREAVCAPRGPLLIVAGAGSGKTSVLTRRVAWQIEHEKIAPYRILAMTFTNKAAGEMRTRIEKLLDGERGKQVNMGTFHSFCYKLLRIEHVAAKLTRGFAIYDEDDSRKLARSLCVGDLEGAKAGIGAHLSAISLAKNRGIKRELFALDAQSNNEELTARLWERYEAALAANGSLDFDDLLSRTLALLDDDAAVLEKWSTKFDCVLIDEFQDTSVVQARIADRLAERTRNITIVGDPKQSIYLWRGSEIKNILTFAHTYPEALTVKLEENYRSTQPILDAANTVVAKMKGVEGFRLFSKRVQGNKPQLIQVLDADAEAAFVIKQVRTLQAQGISPTEVAVLFRTGAQSRPLEEACIRAGLPYRLVGGARFFERREVKDLLAYLRMLTNPADEIAFMRVLDYPKRGLGTKALNSIIDHARSQNVSLLKAMRTVPLGAKQRNAVAALTGVFATLNERAQFELPSVFIRTATLESGLQAALGQEADGPERLDNLRELANLASEFDTQSAAEGGLEELLAHAALLSAVDEAKDGKEALTLMTLHAAKGLEYKAVFLVGADDGLLPHRSTFDDDDALEEERRLAYVGVTRAKDHLFLVCASRRQVFGSWDDASPSRYVEELRASGDLDERAVTPPRIPANVAWRGGGGGVGANTNWKSARPSYGPATGPKKAAPVRFSVGQKVFHPKFGVGLVEAIKPFGSDDHVLTVTFTSGSKKLLGSISPLSAHTS